MPSTYTVNLGIEKPATGEQSGTWGDTTNVNFDIIDQAVNGSERVTLTSAGTSGSPNDLNIVNGSTTSSEGRNKWIEIYSASDLGGSAYVRLVPNDAEKILFIRNSLAGSQSVLLFQGTYNASNDLEIPAGVDMVVKFDGAGASATVTDVFTKLRATEITTPTLTAGTADINGGSIDGATVGAASASTGAFTTLTASTSLNIASSTTVDGVLDEDNMASDSATKLATQQSIKAYVDSQVGTVDTLAEILANGNTSGANNLIMDNGQALTTNTINETTAGSGVTIDSVLLKDDVVNATDIETSTISANDGTAAATIANSTGNFTITNFISNSVDIGGGAIDDTPIGGTTANSGAFTTITSSGTANFNDITTITVSSASEALTVISTASAGNTAPDLSLFNQSATPADGDNLGQVLFRGYDDAGTPGTVSYATLFATATDVSAGDEDGKLSFGVASAGTAAGNNIKVVIDNAGVNVTGVVVDDGATHDGDVTFTGASYNVVWDKSDNALEFAANAKATFNTTGEISSNGNDLLIDETGGNKIFIRSSDEVRINKHTGEYMVRAVADGAVTLYHDNSPKIATTSTGIDVTGQTLTDSLTVTGDTVLNDNDAEVLTLQRDSGTDQNTAIHFDQSSYATYVGADSTGGFNVSNTLNLETNIRFSVEQNGDVLFYETPSATPAVKATWDASAPGFVLEDGVPIYFGTNSDFRIEHDGTYNLIDAGSNTMLIQGATITLEDTSGNDFLSVTSGSTTITSRAQVTGTSPDYLLMESDTTDLNTRMVNAAGILEISTLSDNALSQTKRMTIDHSNGDIKFKESNGTDDFMHYDAGSGIVFNQAGESRNFQIEGATYSDVFFVKGSTNRVGILTSNPDYLLDVAGELNADEYHNAEVRSNYAPKISLDFVNSKTIHPFLVQARGSTASYWGTRQHKAFENYVKSASTNENSNELEIALGFYNRGTATNNAATAPDSSTTASTYVENTTLGTHDVYQFSSGLSIANNVDYTGSVWIKSADKTYMTVSIASASTSWVSVTVNLSTGAIVQTADDGSNSNYVSSSITSYPNSWYRVSVTGTMANTAQYILVAGATTGTVSHTTYGRENYTGNGTDEYQTWGWQLEVGSNMSAYTYVSEDAYTYKRLVTTLLTANSGVSRIDHDPVTKEVKGALVEDSTTNQFPQSENLGNAAWSKTNVSVETNVAIAPDGTRTADKLILTAANGYINDDTSVTSGQSYTQSVYAKSNGMRYLQIAPSTGFGSTYQNFDLQTGAIASGDYTAAGASSILDCGGGWYRCAVTATCTASGSGRMLFSMNNDDGSRLTGGGTDSYKGVLMWGMQLEVKSYPSSYVPTAGSTVTRSVDQLYISSSTLEDTFAGQIATQQGTFFVDFEAFPHINGIQGGFSGGIGNGSSTYLGVGYDTGSSGYFQPTHGSLPSASVPTGKRLKSAIRWVTGYTLEGDPDSGETTASYAANGSLGADESVGGMTFLQSLTDYGGATNQGVTLDINTARFSPTNKKSGWIRSTKYYDVDIGRTALQNITEVD